VPLARTPVFDRLWQFCPHAFLRTSGLDVGLPVGQMGNAEVGHPGIGAAIDDGGLGTKSGLHAAPGARTCPRSGKVGFTRQCSLSHR